METGESGEPGFNPRTPCGVRRHSYSAHGGFQTVSIHALLAECDRLLFLGKYHPGGFNPRTPCGVRPVPAFYHSSCLRFQSTHSLRSATSPPPGKRKQSWFQSTHSLRSATWMLNNLRLCHTVSIHALLAECDCNGGLVYPANRGFNPRTPCGVRPILNPLHPRYPLFQSTHSLRSATDCFRFPGGGDGGFNPRTPCGVRQDGETLTWAIYEFQSTHSLRSATTYTLIGIK